MRVKEGKPSSCWELDGRALQSSGWAGWGSCRSHRGTLAQTKQTQTPGDGPAPQKHPAGSGIYSFPGSSGPVVWFLQPSVPWGKLGRISWLENFLVLIIDQERAVGWRGLVQRRAACGLTSRTTSSQQTAWRGAGGRELPPSEGLLRAHGLHSQAEGFAFISLPSTSAAWTRKTPSAILTLQALFFFLLGSFLGGPTWGAVGSRGSRCSGRARRSGSRRGRRC